MVLTSTVAPTDVTRIEAALVAQGRDLHLVDAPISGGPSRASEGDLSIMASGDTSALSKAYSLLKALSCSAGRSDNLHFIRMSTGPVIPCIFADLPHSWRSRLRKQDQGCQPASRRYPHCRHGRSDRFR